jgi:Ca2+-binding EF-hand superfamily protein
MRWLLTLVALAIATPAVAQPQNPPRPERVQVVRPPSGSGKPAAIAPPQATIIAEPVAMMIAAFDSDGDARVTRTEFDAGVKRSFDSVDAGHSGSVSYIAFGDWAERWLGDRNALPNPFEVDRDGDNRITLDELMLRFDLYFTRFDADKDGTIVRSELLTVRNPAPIGRGRRGRSPDE